MDDPKKTKQLTGSELSESAKDLARDASWNPKAFRKRKNAKAGRLHLNQAQQERLREAQVSARERKQSVQQGVRTLRNKPGWDPRKRVSESLDDTLQRLDQETRSEKAYAEAVACQACLEIQQATQDQSALCEEHLAAAMGF